MSYKKATLPEDFKKAAALDNDLAGMGIHIACDRPSIDPNIEDTLVAASIDELINGNSRVLALITDWIQLHFERINADRLYNMVSSLDLKGFKSVRVYWAAVGKWLSKDRRFHRFENLYKGPRISVLELRGGPNLTNDLVMRHGEDHRFVGSVLIVPNGVLRHRPKDIMAAREISGFHMPFRYRIMMGPSFRADMWACLRRKPNASAYEVAKESYGSYESARRTKRDYLTVKRDYSKREVA